ncbi:MAG: DUF6169 family protein [Bacteroidales bacterium]|nr:DUF6169 family protein [Bacteroidales bacterium]
MVELNLETINLTSPYSIERVGEGKYVFTSEYDIDFFVEFMPEDNIKSDEAYQFLLVNLKHKPSPKDPKVRNTVFEILKNFFDLNNHTVLYICDTGDNRQFQRNRLFANWFYSSEYGKKLTMLQSQIQDEYGVENYVTLLSRNDNPNLTSVINEFMDLVRLLEDKPN